MASGGKRTLDRKPDLKTLMDQAREFLKATKPPKKARRPCHYEFHTDPETGRRPYTKHPYKPRFSDSLPNEAIGKK